MMNEHDFNMQMQLNSSVNLGFLCVCLCESFLFFAHLMEQKQTEKQFNSAVLFFAIRSLIFLLQSVCWSRFQGDVHILFFIPKLSK